MLKHELASAAKPSRVVVLGARGFVARRLIGRLESSGISCRAVGRAEVDLAQPSAAAALRGVFEPGDAVVLVSALTPEHGRDLAAFLKNVAMADSVCAALAGAGCAHAVYISSDSVYAARDGEIDEECCCESGDLYALSHIVREKLLLEACGTAGVPLAILRPTAIYGAGDTHNSYGPNRFLRSALYEGRITLFGGGEEERDHVYIDDVTALIELCLGRRSAGVLNAASGEAISFGKLARSIQTAIGRPVAIESSPRRVPIVHRRFRACGLRSAFPGFTPTPIEDGIRTVVQELAESGHR
jgi:nucleoside-diphosphate-sugar epimerase